ncbi:MAG: hypothetical protein JWL60_1964, partial [Gemmatimonadetes bacterium]|nr:hypothetical protein [Gemmatimonadota bacterium]
MRRLALAGLLIGIHGTVGCGQSDRTPRARGGDVDLSLSAARARLASDALTRRADSLVRAGRHWRATALLAPRLRTPGTATPEQRLAG